MSDNPPADKRVMIGVLAILFGGFGVHRFMLGDTKGGLLRIASMCLCLGGIIGIIEGIIYLRMTDEEWFETYVEGEKEWF